MRSTEKTYPTANFAVKKHLGRPIKPILIAWASDERVSISSATIRRRKLRGMTDEEALFSPSKTRSDEFYKAKCKELLKDLAA